MGDSNSSVACQEGLGGAVSAVVLRACTGQRFLTDSGQKEGSDLNSRPGEDSELTFLLGLGSGCKNLQVVMDVAAWTWQAARSQWRVLAPPSSQPDGFSFYGRVTKRTGSMAPDLPVDLDC